MYDTLRAFIRVPTFPTIDDLCRHGASQARGGSLTDRGGELTFIPRVLLRNRAGIRYTFNPERAQISAEVSLPRLVFGNNYTLLTSADDPLTILDRRIAADLGTLLILPPIGTWGVSKIDYCYQWQCADEDEIRQRLRAIRERKPRRFRRVTVDDSNGLSVTWKSTRRDIILYDKSAEVSQRERDHPCPPGLLRLEVRHKNTAAHQQLARDIGSAGMCDVATLVSPGAAYAALARFHAELRLSEPLQSRFDPWECIRGAVPDNGRATSEFRNGLMASWSWIERSGPRLARRQMGEPKYLRHLRDFRRYGVPLPFGTASEFGKLAGLPFPSKDAWVACAPGNSPLSNTSNRTLT